MSVFLEWKKAKRTGFLSVFFGGGILAAAVPAFALPAKTALSRIGSDFIFCIA